MTTYTQPAYPHGGGFSRNIVNYIEQVVGRALCDLDIEMPEIENLKPYKTSQSPHFDR